MLRAADLDCNVPEWNSTPWTSVGAETETPTFMDDMVLTSEESSFSDGPQRAGPRGSVRGAQRQFLHRCQLAQYRPRGVQAARHS